MAARLTVVISQSAIRDARAAEAEESLLADLIMTRNLDATLIGPLENVQSGSTDFLCLSGFNHSLALVSWLNPRDAARHWQRLELHGQVVEVGQAKEPSSNGRRVYHFSLDSAPSKILAQLRQLLSDRNVQTVNLLLPTKSDNSPIRPSASTQSISTLGTSEPLVREARSETVPIPETSGTDLDRLVEDFESLDL